MTSSLKFGTSGLRGLATDLVGVESRRYAAAFLRYLKGRGEVRQVLVGRDLRASSPEIAASVISALDVEIVDCGELPTPALALEAMRRGAPAIMVTGSHIPADRNGLKFYRADGEIDKADEAAILAAQVVGAEVRFETGAEVEQPVEGAPLGVREHVVGAAKRGSGGDGRPARHRGGQRPGEQEGRVDLRRAPGLQRRRGRPGRLGGDAAERLIQHVGKGHGTHVP